MMIFRLQTPAQLADHLRSFRKARGLTQADLGKLSGVNQARIAKIERDPTRMSVGQLLQLLAALRVRVLLEVDADEADAKARNRASDW